MHTSRGRLSFFAIKSVKHCFAAGTEEAGVSKRTNGFEGHGERFIGMFFEEQINLCTFVGAIRRRNGHLPGVANVRFPVTPSSVASYCELESLGLTSAAC